MIKRKNKVKDKWVMLGVVGVDSGQLMICDPGYLSGWKDCESEDEYKHGEFSYAGACNAREVEGVGGQLYYAMGHAGIGVVFDSGLGDGTYKIFAKIGEVHYGHDYKDIRVKEIRVKLV